MADREDNSYNVTILVIVVLVLVAVIGFLLFYNAGPEGGEGDQPDIELNVEPPSGGGGGGSGGGTGGGQ